MTRPEKMIVADLPQPSRGYPVISMPSGHSIRDASCGHDSAAVGKNIVARYQPRLQQACALALTNTFRVLTCSVVCHVRVLISLCGSRCTAAFVSAAFLVRIFIILSDCTHGCHTSLPARNDVLVRSRRPDLYRPYALAVGKRSSITAARAILDGAGTGDYLADRRGISQCVARRRCLPLGAQSLVLFCFAPMVCS
jgi:hypothetical protein